MFNSSIRRGFIRMAAIVPFVAGDVISGKEFNEKYKEKYVKLINKENNHNGYKYGPGLNTLDGPFNPRHVCRKGGLYFCQEDDIGRWIEYGTGTMEYVCDVVIPDDAKVLVMENKLKTDKFELTNKRNIWTDEEYCKKAVKEDGMYLKYVTNQTEEICEIAIKNVIDAFEYVEYKTDHLYKIAVEDNGMLLEFIEDQTEEICELAVKNNPRAIDFIKSDYVRIKLAIYSGFGII